MENKELINLLKRLAIAQEENIELSAKIIKRIRILEKRQKFWRLVFTFSLAIIIFVNFIINSKILREEWKLLSIDTIAISLIEDWRLFWIFGHDVFWAILENLPFYSLSLLLINFVLIVYFYKMLKNIRLFKLMIKIKNGY